MTGTWCCVHIHAIAGFDKRKGDKVEDDDDDADEAAEDLAMGLGSNALSRGLGLAVSAGEEEQSMHTLSTLQVPQGCYSFGIPGQDPGEAKGGRDVSEVCAVAGAMHPYTLKHPCTHAPLARSSSATLPPRAKPMAPRGRNRRSQAL